MSSSYFIDKNYCLGVLCHRIRKIKNQFENNEFIETKLGKTMKNAMKTKLV
jgi:hypothetical protein